MLRELTAAVFGAALTIAASAAESGPCTSEIDAAQADVDARIEATGESGPYGVESEGAKLHHQPTPGSIAEAEARLGEGESMVAAVDALAEARAADREGDAAKCRQALSRVQEMLRGKG